MSLDNCRTELNSQIDSLTIPQHNLDTNVVAATRLIEEIRKQYRTLDVQMSRATTRGAAKAMLKGSLFILSTYVNSYDMAVVSNTTFAATRTNERSEVDFDKEFDLAKWFAAAIKSLIQNVSDCYEDFILTLTDI